MRAFFTTEDFAEIGVCRDGLNRVRAFGGVIENSLNGWVSYIEANPDAWRAPLFTAWKLHRRGEIHCPDLIWGVARIAFREQPERNAHLRVYATTLGSENWRAAAYAAYAAADADADAAAADAADAAAAAAAAAADAAYAAADAAADAYAAYAAYAADADARSRVRMEIVTMAVNALTLE